MNDLELLLLFNESFHQWTGYIDDPWSKEQLEEFALLPHVELPIGSGVYMFYCEKLGPYYIGKAKNSLHSRLKGKLRADIRERRVLNKRNEDGKLEHAYPYLGIYEGNPTRLYYLNLDGVMADSVVERILLAAYSYCHHGQRPNSNRTGVPSFARLNDERAVVALREIAENFNLA